MLTCTLAISVTGFNSSVFVCLVSKELLTDDEGACNSRCAKISVHSFSCWTPLTLLYEK